MSMSDAVLTAQDLAPGRLVRAAAEGIDRHYPDATPDEAGLLALVIACRPTGQWALLALARRTGCVGLDEVMAQLEGAYVLPSELEVA